MTDKEIFNAAIEAEKKHGDFNYQYQGEAFHDGFIAGAHSRDEEIAYLTYRLNDTTEKLQTVIAERDNLCDPWISIEDEQPKEFQYVYTHDKMLTEESIDNYKISQYLGSNRWAQADGEYETQFTGVIDYWMPIPELKRKK